MKQVSSGKLLEHSGQETFEDEHKLKAIPKSSRNDDPEMRRNCRAFAQGRICMSFWTQSCSFFFQQDFSLLDRPAVGAAFLVPPLLRIHQRPWPQLLYLPVCDTEFTTKNSSRLKMLFMRKLPLNGFASGIFACAGPQV